MLMKGSGKNYDIPVAELSRTKLFWQQFIFMVKKKNKVLFYYGLTELKPYTSIFIFRDVFPAYFAPYIYIYQIKAKYLRISSIPKDQRLNQDFASDLAFLCKMVNIFLRLAFPF